MRDRAKVLASHHRYDTSAKGRSRRARYWASEKGRANRARDNASASKRARDLRYRQHDRALIKYATVRQMMAAIRAKETT